MKKTRHREFRNVILVSALGLVMVAHAQEEADPRKEMNFHQIYRSFNENPTSEERWNAALGAAQGEGYLLQSGDTLWGISETYFGDPDFWPKIWALNQDSVFNPHEVIVGDEIRFKPGTLDEPPSVEVTKPEAQGEAQAGESASAGAESQQAEIAPEAATVMAPAPAPTPEPEEGPLEINGLRLGERKVPRSKVDLSAVEVPRKKRRKGQKFGVTKLPESLPYWKMRGDPDYNIELEVTSITRSAPANEINLLSWVQTAEIDSQGEIVECEAGMHSAHENQYVVVRLKNPVAGQRLLVQTDLGEVSGMLHSDEARVVQIEGEIQVGEAVDPDENLYRALVVKAFAPILVGQQLAGGEVQRIPVDEPAEAGSEVSARIVGGAFNNARKIFGPGEILFLDAGSKSGASVGQSYPIYRVEQLRSNQGSLQKINPRRIGSVKVVRVDEAFSTAVVTSAAEELHVGDSATKVIDKQ